MINSPGGTSERIAYAACHTARRRLYAIWRERGRSALEAHFAADAPRPNLALDLCLDQPADWPAHHDALLMRCAAAGQTRPTPLQAILLLDRPGIDFDAGELLLVEQRPRRQSIPKVRPLQQGAIAVIPVKYRPVTSPRASMRSFPLAMSQQYQLGRWLW